MLFRYLFMFLSSCCLGPTVFAARPHFWTIVEKEKRCSAALEGPVGKDSSGTSWLSSQLEQGEGALRKQVAIVDASMIQGVQGRIKASIDPDDIKHLQQLKDYMKVGQRVYLIEGDLYLFDPAHPQIPFFHVSPSINHLVRAFFDLTAEQINEDKLAKQLFPRFPITNRGLIDFLSQDLNHWTESDGLITLLRDLHYTLSDYRQVEVFKLAVILDFRNGEYIFSITHPEDMRKVNILAKKMLENSVGKKLPGGYTATYTLRQASVVDVGIYYKTHFPEKFKLALADFVTLLGDTYF